MRKSQFNFAHLFGGGRTAASAKPGKSARKRGQEEEQVPAAEGEEDPEAEDEEKEPAAEGEEDPEAEGEEKEPAAEDEEKPKESKAEREARARERRRIGTIISSKAARGRLKSALHLALNTTMPAGAAIGVLKTLPAATVGAGQSRLADRMARHRGVDLGPGGGTDQSIDAEARAMARMVKRKGR